MAKENVSRRKFLKGMGWGSAGLSVFVSGCSHLNPIPPLPHRSDPTAEDASIWLSLRPEGQVEIVSPRSEMGQGISTAIKQIIAEEMKIDISQVRYINPRSDRMPSVKATVGSDSIMSFGPLIASAAAALAEELDLRARAVYGLKTGQYRLKSGQLFAENGQAYDLLPLLSPTFVLSPESIENSKPCSFDSEHVKNTVGKSVLAHDILPIVTASQAVYVDDLSLPNMLHARLVTSPYLNARLLKVSDEKVRSIPGYLGLINEDELTAVVAQSRSILDHVLESLNVEWEPHSVNQETIDQAISIQTALDRGDLEHGENDGNIAQNDPFDVDLTLTVSMAAHASMEPRTAIAYYDENAETSLEVWTATQDVTLTHKNLVQEFSLSEEMIKVHNMRVGGGFGGKVISRIENDAAKISREFGKPVKLQWTREDEFIRGYHRPPSEHRIRARLNSDGQIESWWHAFTSGHVIFSSAFLPPWMQGLTSFVADKGVKRGAIPPYEIANRRIEFEDVRIPVNTGPWRGLGATPNCWAIETAVDELARKNKIDPFEFRLNQLQQSQPRLRKVLMAVSSLCNWKTRVATETVSYGIACGIYKDRSYSATVAEVKRKPDSTFQVTSLWSVHDCGMVVNPDMVRAQIEGNLMWGIGTVFNEQLVIEDNGLSASNFDGYEWASFQDTPDITIELVGQDAQPTGAGEAAIVSAAASVTNAISAMTGKAVLQLPIKG